ncbi:aromatic ring-hydroxylating dioxygenase subunit alpha [Nonomuraea sp. NPDC049480]|uniref:aromatic ring-hydroxylating dioxygenase subunit alpha n=1 Tax=Nonomuraea sp. NPDC049480 TaxID=3364353 RepID=UPI0037B59567
MSVDEVAPALTPDYVPGLDLRAAATDGGERAQLVRRDANALLARLLTHYEDKTTDQAADIMRMPVRDYLDDTLWQEELRAVHRQVPLPVAMSCELPRPGTYKAMDVIGVPVLITRDRDGVVHAMVNACRHRGSPVTELGTGTASRLTCPYHSWSYDLSGCLRGIYGEKTFGEVDRGARSLIPLPAEERAGIVFVGLRPGTSLDLDTWLGDLTPLLEGLGLADLHHHSTMELPGPNWKVTLDGYLETYHFASLHRGTVFKTNLSNMTAFDRWGPHQRNAAALRGITDEALKPIELRDPAKGVGPNYFIFPAMAIAGGYRQHVAISIVLPGRTRTESVTQQIIGLRRPPADEEERRAADRTRDWFFEVVRDEDYAAQYAVDRGLTALDGTDLLFGRNEPGVQHLHRAIRQHVALLRDQRGE